MLTKTEMSYYSDIGGKLKGSIPVHTMVGVSFVGAHEPVDRTACTTKPKKPVCDFAFRVDAMLSGGPRSFYVICTTEGERDEWVVKLRSLIHADAKQSHHHHQQQQQQQHPQPPQRASVAGRATASRSSLRSRQLGSIRISKPTRSLTVVPRSDRTQTLNILRQPWFRRSATPEEVKDYLASAPPGAFVVKDSAQQGEGSFDLYVQTGSGTCKLYVQKQQQQGTKCWGVPGTGIAFEHLLDFVFHYTQTPFRAPNLPGGRVVLSLSSCANAEKQWRVRHGTMSRPAVRPQVRRKQQQQQQQQRVTPVCFVRSLCVSVCMCVYLFASRSSLPFVHVLFLLPANKHAQELHMAGERIAMAAAELSVLSQRYTAKKQKLDDLRVSVKISSSSLDMRLQTARDECAALRSRVSNADNNNTTTTSSSTSSSSDSLDDAARALRDAEEQVAEAARAVAADALALDDHMERVGAIAAEMASLLETLEQRVDSAKRCLQAV